MTAGNLTGPRPNVKTKIPSRSGPTPMGRAQPTVLGKAIDVLGSARRPDGTGHSAYSVTYAAPPADPTSPTPHPTGAGGGGSVDLKAIYSLLHPSTPTVGIDQGMVDALHKSYDDQVNSINTQHDAQLAHLEQLHANGAAGVNKYGGDLQTALAGLAHDAMTRGKAVNGDIDRTYGQGHADASGEFKKLAADLKNSGAQGAGLKAEEGGSLQLLANMRALTHSDSVAQQGDLQQMLNNRKSEGKSMTTGSLDDMLGALQTAQYNAEQQRTSQIGQAQQAQDSGMLQAAHDASSQNAAYRQAQYSAQLKAVTATAKPMTPAQFNDLLKSGGYGTNDVAGAFKDVLSGKDTNSTQVALGSQYLNDITTGKYSATQAYQHWMAQDQKVRDANPQVGSALALAISNEASTSSRKKNALTIGSALGINK